MRMGIEIASPVGTATRGPGGRAVVGSARPADLIVGHPAVAPAHLEIADTPNGWMIRDLGSRTGTFVDGRPLAGPAPVGPGIQVRLGHPVQGPLLRLRPVTGPGAPAGAAGPAQAAGPVQATGPSQAGGPGGARPAGAPTGPAAPTSPAQAPRGPSPSTCS
ncbi:MAG: FHA domain-containing protein [Actinomycetaceae bacterium]